MKNAANRLLGSMAFLIPLDVILFSAFGSQLTGFFSSGKYLNMLFVIF